MDTVGLVEPGSTDFNDMAVSLPLAPSAFTVAAGSTLARYHSDHRGVYIIGKRDYRTSSAQMVTRKKALKSQTRCHVAALTSCRSCSGIVS